MTRKSTTSESVVLQPYTEPPTPLRTAALKSPTPPTASSLETVKAETAGTNITRTLSVMFGTDRGSTIPQNRR